MKFQKILLLILAIITFSSQSQIKGSKASHLKRINHDEKDKVCSMSHEALAKTHNKLFTSARNIFINDEVEDKTCRKYLSIFFPIGKLEYEHGKDQCTQIPSKEKRIQYRTYEVLCFTFYKTELN